MICGDCEHFKPTRSDKTGRVLTREPGNCRYPVVWPKLPKVFNPLRWDIDQSIQFPRRRQVWKDDAYPCELFAAKKVRQKKVSTQIELIKRNSK